MSQKRKKMTNKEIRSQKKAIVLKNNQKTRLPIVLSAVGVILGIGGIFFYQTMSKNGDTIEAAPQKANLDSDTVAYDVAMFADGQARHFDFADGSGKTIRYFDLSGKV